MDDSDIRGCFFREQAISLQEAGHKVGVIHPNLRSLLSRKRLLKFRFGYHFENDTNVSTLQYHNIKWLQPIPLLQIKFELHIWRHLYHEYVKLYGKPQLAHVHSMLNAGLFANWLFKEEGIPYVITEHSSLYLRKRLAQNDLLRAKCVAGQAVKRLSVSQALCDRLSAVLGKGPGPWEEMPNLVDHRTFNPKHFSEKSRNGEFVFVCIANLWKNKGIHYLLQAFAEKFVNNTKVKLKIGGSGPQYFNLKRLTFSLGIQSQVEFLGSLSRNDVPKTLAKSDVFVLPSLYETFGVVFVEAIMMGKPVIATKSGGPESIVNTCNGLLVPTGEIHSLAQAMDWARENYDTFDPDSIREDAVSRFSVDSVVKRLCNIYDEIFENTSLKPR